MDYIKRKQRPRYYVDLGSGDLYSIFDRGDNDNEIESGMNYGDAVFRCDQANKGDF